jgi:hypothetical protein
MTKDQLRAALQDLFIAQKHLNALRSRALEADDELLAECAYKALGAITEAETVLEPRLSGHRK